MLCFGGGDQVVAENAIWIFFLNRKMIEAITTCKLTRCENINCAELRNWSNHSFAGVPFPPSNKLTVAEVFDPRTNKPKPEVLKQHFILEGRLDEATALKIIKGGAAILKDEDTMIELEAPVTGEKKIIITSSS